MKRKSSTSLSGRPYKVRRATGWVGPQYVAPDTRKLLLLQKKVNSISRNIEVKQSEASETGSMVVFPSGPLWGFAVGVSDIAQGTADNQRIGNQITLKELHVSIQTRSPVALLQSIVFRTLIFNDKQHSNSATLASANPFSGTTSPLEEMVTGNDEVSVMQYKYDMRSRYTIYRDTVTTHQPIVALDYDPATGNTSQVIQTVNTQNFKIKLPNLKVNYTDAAGVNASVSNNMVQFFVAGTQTGVNPPDYSITYRVLFTD